MNPNELNINSTSLVSIRLNVTLLRSLNEGMFHRLAPVVVILIAIMAIGTVGNLAICYIFAAKLRKNSQNLLLLCLGTFDLMSSCVGVTSELIDVSSFYLYEPVQLCKVMRFLTTIPTLASILILLVIAVDRYLKICRPLGYQLRLVHVRTALAIILIISVIFSVPALFIYGHRTLETPIPDLYGHDCSIDDSYKTRLYPAVYMSSLFAAFVVSTSSLVIIYTRIGLETRRHIRYMKAHSSYGSQLLDAGTTTTYSVNESNSDNGVEILSQPGSRKSSKTSVSKKQRYHLLRIKSRETSLGKKILKQSLARSGDAGRNSEKKLDFESDRGLISSAKNNQILSPSEMTDQKLEPGSITSTLSSFKADTSNVCASFLENNVEVQGSVAVNAIQGPVTINEFQGPVTINDFQGPTARTSDMSKDYQHYDRFNRTEDPNNPNFIEDDFKIHFPESSDSTTPRDEDVCDDCVVFLEKEKNTSDRIYSSDDDDDDDDVMIVSNAFSEKCTESELWPKKKFNSEDRCLLFVNSKTSFCEVPVKSEQRKLWETSTDSLSDSSDSPAGGLCGLDDYRRDSGPGSEDVVTCGVGTCCGGLEDLSRSCDGTLCNNLDRCQSRFDFQIRERMPRPELNQTASTCEEVPFTFFSNRENERDLSKSHVNKDTCDQKQHVGIYSQDEDGPKLSETESQNYGGSNQICSIRGARDESTKDKDIEKLSETGLQGYQRSHQSLSLDYGQNRNARDKDRQNLPETASQNYGGSDQSLSMESDGITHKNGGTNPDLDSGYVINPQRNGGDAALANGAEIEGQRSLTDVQLRGGASQNRFDIRASQLFQKRKSSSPSLTLARCARRALRTTRPTIIAFVITLGFIISYLPHLVLTVLRYLIADLDHSLRGGPLILYNVFLRSYLVNNVINIFVYGSMNLEFRNEMMKMCKKCRCRNR